MYPLLRPLLFLMDAEEVHEEMLSLGERMGRSSAVRGFVEKWYRYDDPRLATDLFGLHFRNPIGLAAGFDKDARLLDLLPALGFGFIEPGTVTPLPQVGNPKPRLFRLPEDKAIVNRMGFNNGGVERFAARFARRERSIPAGANIGRGKETPNESAIDDYVKGFLAVADHADYVAVNVSSPNTPGLRALQDKEPMRNLLEKIQELNRDRDMPKPILLKIAPDLSEGQLADIVELVQAASISGIIATNTTVGRGGLKTPVAEVEAIGNGGLSGRPVRARSTEVIRYLYRASEGKIPIIGVGGIFSARDAYAKIRAGASLVQVFSGLTYEGPGLVRRIKQDLVKLLAKDGFKSIKEVVGIDASNVHD